MFGFEAQQGLGRLLYKLIFEFQFEESECLALTFKTLLKILGLAIWKVKMSQARTEKHYSHRLVFKIHHPYSCTMKLATHKLKKALYVCYLYAVFKCWVNQPCPQVYLIFKMANGSGNPEIYCKILHKLLSILVFIFATFFLQSDQKKHNGDDNQVCYVAKYFTLWGVFCRVSQGLQNHLPFLNITKTLGKWLLSNQ